MAKILFQPLLTGTRNATKDLVILTTLMTGLMACAARGQATGLSTCPLDPELLGLQERCARVSLESTSAICNASRILEMLARGDTTAAEEILARNFALPEASRKRMMPWLLLLGSTLIDLKAASSECTHEQAQRMLELVGSGLFESLEHPESLVLLGRALDWPEKLMTMLEDPLEPAVGIALRTLGRAVGKLPPFTAGQLSSSEKPEKVAKDISPPHPPTGDEATRRADLTADPEIRRTQQEEILRHISERAYRDAIREIAAWELEVLSGRPSSAYESGSFRSRALQLAFRVPGDWQQFDPPGEDLARLQMFGSSLEVCY